MTEIPEPYIIILLLAPEKLVFTSFCIETQRSGDSIYATFECIEYICTLCGININSAGTKNKTTYKKQLIPLIEHYVLTTLKINPICFGLFLFTTQNKTNFYVPTFPTPNKSYAENDILSFNWNKKQLLQIKI